MTACYRLLASIVLLFPGLVFQAPAQIASLPATFEVRTVQGFPVPFQNGMPVPIFEKQRRPTLDLKGVWRKQRFIPNQAISLGPRDSAGMAALHAEAATPDATDWSQIAALYGTLAALIPSPVVEVNRAVAVAMAEGPQQGLRILEGLGDRAKGYYPFHVVCADLLRRSDQLEEAIQSYEQAIALCNNPAERSHLQRQLAPLIDAGRGSSPGDRRSRDQSP